MITVKGIAPSVEEVSKISTMPVISEFNGYFQREEEDHHPININQAQIDFIVELISIIQHQAPFIVPSDTILAEESIENNSWAYPIIRFKDLGNLSLYLDVNNEFSCIRIFWGELYVVCPCCDIDSGYEVSIFNKTNDSQFKDHALERFAQELKREIQVTYLYVDDTLIKIEYHIKKPNGKYFKVGSKSFADFSFWHIFKHKTKRISVSTLENLVAQSKGV